MNSYGVDPTTACSEIGNDATKIRQNALLEQIYLDVYARIVEEVPAGSFPRLLELGSGGGFLRQLAPNCITSECVEVPGVDLVVDACRITESFSDDSLDAIVAFNVFHHLPDAPAFLRGASRVLRPGGRIVLVEPWFTAVGQWFYRLIHHEPSLLDPSDWRIVGEGRLNGANSRLPTSVFRDNPERFRSEFPDLRISRTEPFHKWLYLASGGLRLNTRIPKRLAERLVALDKRVKAGNEALGLFALIVVDKLG